MSFDAPEYTFDITGTGTVRLLEAIRETGIKPRLYQASSSEMFGMMREVLQTERTPFYPRIIRRSKPRENGRSGENDGRALSSSKDSPYARTGSRDQTERGSVRHCRPVTK